MDGSLALTPFLFRQSFKPIGILLPQYDRLSLGHKEWQKIALTLSKCRPKKIHFYLKNICAIGNGTYTANVYTQMTDKLMFLYAIITHEYV